MTPMYVERTIMLLENILYKIMYDEEGVYVEEDDKSMVAVVLDTVVNLLFVACFGYLTYTGRRE